MSTMSAIDPLGNDNDVATTPLQTKRHQLPQSEGRDRAFGTPLSGNSSILAGKSVTTSKKARVRHASSSKKLVRAKKIVQQHRNGNVPSTSLSAFVSPMAGKNNTEEFESFTYTVNFLPGPMGFQPEPSHGDLGCRVLDFADGGPESPGQARMSNQVQAGDFIVEINDDVVSHLTYNEIVDQLKSQADKPRKVLFRRMRRGKAEGATSLADQLQFVATPRTNNSRPSPTTMQFNAQGKLTPVVSPPMVNTTDSDESNAAPNNLFADSKEAATTTTPFVRTESYSSFSQQSTTSPRSPAYKLLDSPANAGDVVLEINDPSNASSDHKDESIDTSSTISPSKVKNMSQEDLEIGLGHRLTSGITSKANVWRNMFSSVSKLGGALQQSGSNNKDAVSGSEDYSTAQMPNVIEDSATEEKKDDEAYRMPHHELKLVPSFGAAAMEPVKQAPDLVQMLEQRLTEANERVQALSSSLGSKQAELDRRLQQADEEANERVKQVSEIQLAKQKALEQKLVESSDITRTKEEELQGLQTELNQAKESVLELAKERDEALTSLRNATETIQSMSTEEKSAQLTSKVELAKLQRELRECKAEWKKEVEAAKSDIATAETQLEEAESRRLDAERELEEKDDELQGTKCMMETYEEKFMERESKMEAMIEEKDFAARELAFARAENQRLTESLQKREEEAAMAEDEIERLQASADMTSKELADQQQQAHDRERDLQEQLTRRDSEVQQLHSDFGKLEMTSAEKIQSLEETLVKRDEDLRSLKDEIESNVAALKDELLAKDRLLEATQHEMEELKTSNEALLQKYEEQVEKAEDLAKAQSGMRTSLYEREEALANKTNELEEAKHTLSSLQKTNESLEADTKQLKGTADELYQEKARVTKELQTTKFDLSDAKIQAAKVQDALLQRAKQLDGKLKQSQTDLKKAENHGAALSGRLERANSKINNLTAEVEKKDGAVQGASATIKGLEETRDQLSQREAALKAQLEEKEAEKQLLQEGSRDAKFKLFEATNRNKFMQRQIDEYESGKASFEREFDVLNEEIESLNSKLESQQEALDSKSSELSSKSVQVMNLESTLEQLRGELQQKSEEIDSVQRSVVSAQSQYSALNDRFVKAAEESSGKIQQLTADLIKALDDADDSAKARTKLDKQISSLTQQLQHSEDKISSLSANLRSKEERIVELGALNESAKKESEAVMNALRVENDKLGGLAKQLEQEIKAKTKDKGQLHGEISSLEKKLANARSLFGAEQQKHKTYRAEMEDLHLTHKQEVASMTKLLKSTSSDLESVRKELQNSQIGYEDQLTIMRKDAATKEAKVTELLKERDTKNKILANVHEELSMAQLEIQRVDESRKRSRDEVARLNALVETLQKDNEAQLEAVTKSHQVEIERWSKNNEQLEMAIEKAAATRKKLESHMEKLEELVEEERSRNETLMMEQDALTSNLHRAEDIAADLGFQLNMLQQQSDDSLDSIDSQTLALSKSELRAKCKNLSEEVQESEVRVATTGSVLSQKQAHIRRLEEDLAEMSSELERMVESSEKLEAALLKARMDKATCEADAEALRSSVDVHQEKTRALKEELNQQYSENSELLDQVRDLQQQQDQAKEREQLWQEDLEKAKQVMMLLDEDKIEAQKESSSLQGELETMKEQREALAAKVNGLQSQIGKLEDKLSTTEKERDLVSTESHSIRVRLEEQLRELRNECATLTSSIASLESDNETCLSTIRSMEENKMDLQEKLEKERKHGLRQESLREEAVAELTEASRVLESQKGVVSVQEARAAEAEEKVKRLSSEVSTLRDAINKLENDREQNGVIRSSQLEEMEKRRALLEKARLAAKAEADSLRDEVRQANRKASELDRINKSLQSRIEDLKTTAETTKAQLREVRSAWEASESVAKKLENDLQSGRAEIDHLRMKLQLGGATIARLKSDRVLLQEAAMQQAATLEMSAEPNTVAREMSKLKSELHTRSSQLSSATTSARNYKRMCNDMKVTEKQLVIFIDDIISQADATFVALAHLAEGARESSASEVSTSGTPEKVVNDANCCLSHFATLISEAAEELENKKKKLHKWKAQSKIHTTTPQQKSLPPDALLLTPNQSSAIRAFQKMKSVIETQFSKASDFHQVESAIMSLESQIDALCSELKAANNALCAKDKLFADIEQERNKIQKKLELVSGPANKGNGNNLSAIREEQELSEDKKEEMMRVGAKQMAKVLFDNKAKAEAANALRKWSNLAAASHAADQQHHAAAALSKQLELTRGKLAQLKTQFKRGKSSQVQA